MPERKESQASAMDMEKLKELREKAARLPLHPGVYIMKDLHGHIIYIGKAKALKNRVSQYFMRVDKHENKVRKMVENVCDFAYILTDSEFEALVLECSLIKQHKPKYNILLKDDKGYSYIRITLSEEWPRIQAVKRKDDDGALYLGPYMSSFSVKQAVDEAVKAFLLPVCSRRFPQEIGRGRPCLNYDIHQCCAPCRGKMNSREYREIVDSAVTFLRGGYEPVFEKLTAEMENAAERLEFEKAARLRDRIAAIRRIREKQKVVSCPDAELDVIALASDGINTVFEVFIVRGGRLIDKCEYEFPYLQDEKEARAEFIRRYYSLAKSAPALLALDGETADRALLERYLSENFHRKCRITLPQKGRRAQFVNMVKLNAREHLNQMAARPGRELKTLGELQKLLGLSETPEYIEAYDISHTAGAEIVAGMVAFERGLPQKSAYRRFSLKSLSGQDDYAAMREVVYRRLARLREALDKGQEGEGFARKPDLILLDGGTGHVNAVKPVLAELRFNIPLFGMVKDDKHRTRAIAADGGEIEINASRSVFTFISKIQDEVHRFAISYHHSKHARRAFATQLTEAPLIGPGRARELLRHFKSLSAIRAATPEELCAVKGMSRPAAEALSLWLRQSDTR